MQICNSQGIVHSSKWYPGRCSKELQEQTCWSRSAWAVRGTPCSVNLLSEMRKPCSPSPLMLPIAQIGWLKCSTNLLLWLHLFLQKHGMASPRSSHMTTSANTMIPTYVGTPLFYRYVVKLGERLTITSLSVCPGLSRQSTA